jgi:hypothetical protein
MSTIDKYETEIHRLLAEAGGSWETLARSLFGAHPAVIAEQRQDVLSIARACSPSSRKKRGRAKKYDFDLVWEMLGRLEAIKYNQRTGGLFYGSRKSALRDGLGLQRTKLARWEKVLSTELPKCYPAWKAQKLTSRLAVLVDDALPDHGECSGCIDCQGVD